MQAFDQNGNNDCVDELNNPQLPQGTTGLFSPNLWDTLLKKDLTPIAAQGIDNLQRQESVKMSGVPPIMFLFMLVAAILSPMVKHVRAVLGLLLIVLAGAAHAEVTESVVYFHKDIGGNVKAATDENGKLMWRQSYLPYGKQRANVGQTLGYQQHQYDGNTGLVYMGARYYDPSARRFISPDPVSAMAALNNPKMLNRYAYANNNPISYTDPDGRIPVDYAVDGISVGISAAIYAKNPTFLNGLGLSADIILAAIPYVPSGIGLVRAAGAASDVARNVTKGVHGNSKLSQKAQHVYEIRNNKTGEVVKTGISQGKISKKGKSYRAERQRRKVSDQYKTSFSLS